MGGGAFFALCLCTLVHGRFWLDKENSRNAKCPDFYLPSHTEWETRFNARLADAREKVTKKKKKKEMNLFFFQKPEIVLFSFLCEDSHVSPPVRDYFFVHASTRKMPGFLLFPHPNRSFVRMKMCHFLSVRAEPSRAEPSATSIPSPAGRLSALHE